jgi:hypothetical protein
MFCATYAAQMVFSTGCYIGDLVEPIKLFSIILMVALLGGFLGFFLRAIRN